MPTRRDQTAWTGRLFPLLLAIVTLVPLQTFGADRVASSKPVSKTPESDRLDVIDVPRNYLSSQIAAFADEIDRFFGGDRHYQESNQSVGARFLSIL